MPSLPPSSTLSLLHLPAELLTITACHLPFPDLLALQLSCHYLYSLLSTTVSGKHLPPLEQMERWDRLPPRCPSEIACANCAKWGWGERVADVMGGKDVESDASGRIGKEKGKEMEKEEEVLISNHERIRHSGTTTVAESLPGHERRDTDPAVAARNGKKGRRGRRRGGRGGGRGTAVGMEQRDWRER